MVHMDFNVYTMMDVVMATLFFYQIIVEIYLIDSNEHYFRNFAYLDDFSMNQMSDLWNIEWFTESWYS